MPTTHKTTTAPAQPGDAAYVPGREIYVWSCTCGLKKQGNHLSKVGARQIAIVHERTGH